ncbi:SPOR domain-containing protein [Helicobacter mustelae]|uniref:Putative inner membrane protein n=1 Tax=Helicobacter mustelae (strain ATCC 43772 / CCUG 25715 / CIP 103759 / LMG 18044 / NCTC 12198 / R85-136P) TaxID=679897 RepID=D3UIQ1_HELM1|nr:SPOR domain-containing protein [Helicobacter mustelae]CBG40376.1 Putative inner membrane protein [Helicobacter mustelae 12198]SQH71875.1 Uncharacterized protein conserved in bacteria [Helicobacter mustelae]
MEEMDFKETLDTTKKKKTQNVVLGVVAVIAILVILLIIWSFTHSNPKEQALEQPQENTNSLLADNQPSSTTQNPSSEYDSFDKIVNEMKDANTPESTPVAAAKTPDAKDDKELSKDSSTQSYTPGHAADAKHAMHDKTQTSNHLAQKITPSPEHVKKSPAKKKRAAKSFDSLSLQKATAGSYLQMGAFAKQPNKTMQNTLMHHDFRTLEFTDHEGQKLTKYLIGPFKSRKQAEDYKQQHPELAHSIYYEVK